MLNKEVDTRSKELLESLTQGLDFSIPNVDLNSDVFKIPPELSAALQKVPNTIELDDLTERQVNGNGVFDGLMMACRVHLKEEFEAGRITGAEYSKAYISLAQTCIQYAVEFLLRKDAAYYGALGAQAQALSANTDAYTARVRLAIAQAEAHANKAKYAGLVLNLSQGEQQIELTDAQTDTQKEQQKLIQQQTEQAHAQVSDTLMDNKTPVKGYTGNQNSLLKQQVVSFKKDAIVKGAKIYADSFATQLSMSSATVAGTGLDANAIGKVMSRLQQSINSDT
jgi:hypothetical protein